MAQGGWTLVVLLIWNYGNYNVCGDFFRRYYSEHQAFQLLDFNDTQVLDFRPTLKTLAMVSVINNKLDYSTLPRDIK